MSINELKDRLQILLEQNVITKEAYDVAITAFKNLMNTLNKNTLQQAETLFTHLPMALSRINNEEEVEKPDQSILQEIKNADSFPMAKEQVSLIEKKLKEVLPEGERDYLHVHYTNVINLNGGN